MDLLSHTPNVIKFSSPIFGDMFLLDEIQNKSEIDSDQFSSPIFGDMFLLDEIQNKSEIDSDQFSSPIFGDMFLLTR